MAARCLPVLVLVIALTACGAAADPEPRTSERLGPVELVEALREGGYVIYFRHTATDQSQEDKHKTDVSRCDGMRNLTDEGREQARAIGRAFRELDIPVGEVLASEYCRTRETAQLAFGVFEREPRLTGFPAEDPPGPYEKRVRTTQALLATPPPDGRNTVLVAHVRNLEAAAELEVAEGEAAVFEPLGGTRFRYTGRIPVSVWPQLVERLSDS